VFRDANGFNVSGASTRHEGIEAGIDWQMGADWLLSLDVTYARHTYDFTFIPERGESFIKGRDVDTAPRKLGSLEVFYEPSEKWKFALQWSYTGPYYLEAQNRFDYPGHAVANLRAAFAVSPRLQLQLRLKNINDKYIADRADFAFGNYRYLPGPGRELYAEIRYLPSD
jgi:outer membrane receptor protein involved in Fe transport